MQVKLGTEFNPFIDIEKLKEYLLISMPKVEWWLLKYYNSYKRIRTAKAEELRFSKNPLNSLPLLSGVQNNNGKFISLYQALDALTELYKYETYFKEEINVFNKLKKDKLTIDSWIKRNEKLGSDTFVCFLVDYLDYDEDEKVKHLNIFIPHSNGKEINISIDRAYFQNTITFLETFNSYYWT
ncbi:MAG: hypothetical protein V7670_03100 [Maribacter arcticus]|uniref:hypothetical protein n=1 Tax=Maribacter arcticus TaxID=561365 RepID=UPI003002AEB5